MKPKQERREKAKPSKAQKCRIKAKAYITKQQATLQSALAPLHNDKTRFWKQHSRRVSPML